MRRRRDRERALYFDATEIALGDRVVVAKGEAGTVIGVIAAGQFDTSLKASAWRDLNAGIVIRLDSGQLLHVREPTYGVRRLNGRRPAE